MPFLPIGSGAGLGRSIAKTASFGNSLETRPRCTNCQNLLTGREAEIAHAAYPASRISNELETVVQETVEWLVGLADVPSKEAEYYPETQLATIETAWFCFEAERILSDEAAPTRNQTVGDIRNIRQRKHQETNQ